MEAVAWQPTNPAVNPASRYLSQAEYRQRRDACTLWHLQHLSAGGLFRVGRGRRLWWRALLVAALLAFVASAGVAGWQLARIQGHTLYQQMQDTWQAQQSVNTAELSEVDARRAPEVELLHTLQALAQELEHPEESHEPLATMVVKEDLPEMAPAQQQKPSLLDQQLAMGPVCSMQSTLEALLVPSACSALAGRPLEEPERQWPAVAVMLAAAMALAWTLGAQGAQGAQGLEPAPQSTPQRRRRRSDDRSTAAAGPPAAAGGLALEAKAAPGSPSALADGSSLIPALHSPSKHRAAQADAAARKMLEELQEVMCTNDDSLLVKRARAILAALQAAEQEPKQEAAVQKAANQEHQVTVLTEEKRVLLEYAVMMQKKELEGRVRMREFVETAAGRLGDLNVQLDVNTPSPARSLPRRRSAVASPMRSLSLAPLYTPT